MRFHGSGETVPLREVRKNLICVPFKALLNLQGQSEECLQTETLDNPPKIKTTAEQKNKAQAMHETADNMDRIQKTQKLPAALTAHQHPEKSGRSIKIHGQKDTYITGLDDGRALREGRCDPRTESALGPPTDLQNSARNQLTPPMGSTTAPERETCREAVHGGVRRRSILCEVDGQECPQDHSIRSQELCKLRQSEAQERSTSQPDDIIIEHDESRSHRQDDIEEFSEPDLRRRMVPDQSTSGIISRDRTDESGKEDHGLHSTDHAGGNKPGAHRESTDSDRNTAKGAEPVHPGGRAQSQWSRERHLDQPPSERQPNSKAHEHKIIQKIEERILQIEDGLSTLPKRKDLCTKPDPEPDRPLDLLEIYCEPNSKLTEQVKQLGGTALRFSRLQGDLSTQEGIQKLWCWINLFEPRHIWMAPDCRYWGAFSRFNSQRSLGMETKIQEGRAQEKPHLELCNSVYQQKGSKGNHFHTGLGTS